MAGFGVCIVQYLKKNSRTECMNSPDSGLFQRSYDLSKYQNFHPTASSLRKASSCLNDREFQSYSTSNHAASDHKANVIDAEKWIQSTVLPKDKGD